MRQIFMMLLIGFLLVGVGMSSCENAKNRKALDDHAAVGVLMPVETYTENTSTNKKTGQVVSKRLSVRYKFRTREGKVITLPEQTVTMEQMQATHTGQVKIEYLPEDPGVWRFKK